MRVIAIRRLKKFWDGGNADAEQPLKVWYQIFKHNNFYNTQEIKTLFPSCSFVGENRVIFNISGNKYRLVVHIRFDIQIVYIRFVGTHSQYDKIDVRKV